MVTQRKPKPSKYLTIPTRPVQVDRDRSVAGLLEKMEGTGFGGRQLAEAHRIWLDMLGDNTTIMMAAAGALIPAGMRQESFCRCVGAVRLGHFPRLARNVGTASFPGPSEYDRCRARVRAD